MGAVVAPKVIAYRRRHRRPYPRDVRYLFRPGRAQRPQAAEAPQQSIFPRRAHARDIEQAGAQRALAAPYTMVLYSEAMDLVADLLEQSKRRVAPR